MPKIQNLKKHQAYFQLDRGYLHYEILVLERVGVLSKLCLVRKRFISARPAAFFGFNVK
jgi:hypothetical protein